MALQINYADDFGRVLNDTYWRIEDIRVKYFKNPNNGATSRAVVVLHGYPSEEWRLSGKQSMPETKKVIIENVEGLNYGDYDSLRSMVYAFCKTADPFFSGAIDV